MAQSPHGPGRPPESGSSRSPRGLEGGGASPETDTDVQMRAARAHPHPQQADSGAEAAGREMREQAERIGQQASQQARALVDEQKGVVAREVHGLADALHRTAQQLGEQEHRPLSSYVERAAQGLDHLAENLEGRSGESLLHQAQDYARRQPAMFIGGAVAAGLMLSRFLKSSRQDQAMRGSGAGHGPERSGAHQSHGPQSRGHQASHHASSQPPGAPLPTERAGKRDELPRPGASEARPAGRASEAAGKPRRGPSGTSTSKTPGGTDEGR
ncbi:hypothetical protein HUS23_09300 [Ectothiorhodospiraceae bacterium 2226]|nr:hypothetical protein HUS23_09300 [Ectothiorhodospiraceae bacterium 2226]